uniref:Pectinesterase inhibitor domain-containing protein n=1 Tax=Triticum urartu TaxID=4572 RepID=A0A8R7K416_TRIUA
MAIAPTTTIIFSAIIIMLFSSATTTQTNNDIGGKPERTHFIVEACKNASINSSEYNHITEEFCVSTLRQDKRSDEAKDLRDLALVGVDILKGHIIAASGKVKEKLHSAKNGTSTAHYLRLCELDYDATVTILNISNTMLDYHGPKGGEKYGPLSYYLPRIVGMASSLVDYCGHDLVDMPGQEALYKENIDLGKLGSLKVALVAPYWDLTQN